MRCRRGGSFGFVFVLGWAGRGVVNAGGRWVRRWVRRVRAEMAGGAEEVLYAVVRRSRACVTCAVRLGLRRLVFPECWGERGREADLVPGGEGIG